MAGRPTKYDPKYCDEVIEFMAEGLSLTAFAGHLRVAKSTINEWMSNHPEFSDAVKIAQGCRTECLERGLLGSEVGPMVTARIFALKNAAPDEWSDKRQIDHTSSDKSMSPAPVIDAKALSSEALREIMKAKSDADAG